jgi:uncharacterized membrane protein
MQAPADFDSRRQVWTAVPNRALGRRARVQCVGVLIGTGLAVAVFAALVGAWPVLPFAGLEALLLWLAFRCLARHDDDFERVEINDGRVRWESRCANRMSALDAHTAWARLLVEDRGGRCRLSLRYAGQTVPVGALVAEPLRRRWAEELGRRIPVIHV